LPRQAFGCAFVDEIDEAELSREVVRIGSGSGEIMLSRAMRLKAWAVLIERNKRPIIQFPLAGEQLIEQDAQYLCPAIPYRSDTIDKPKFFAKLLYKARPHRADEARRCVGLGASSARSNA
jgi:hypothetical protein